MTQSETLIETMTSTSPFPRRPQADSRRIGRRIVATIAAAATALGLLAATSVPARADNNDLAKALAAIAIVGIIASQANKNRPRAQPVDPYQPYQPQPARQPRVPSVCAIEIAGNTGTATVFGERCLRDEGFNFRLPQYCARTARIYGQSDRIYSDQCQRDAGFRVGSPRY